MNSQVERRLESFIVALGFLAALGLLQACEPGESQASDSWVLAWEDEFEGPRLDGASWNIVHMPDPFNE
ncbi:MAG: hypothetical protein JSW71_22645, partial [Gemmatimonadota bacterium]